MMIISFNPTYQIYSFYSLKDNLGRAFNSDGTQNVNMKALPWEKIDLLDLPLPVLNAFKSWEASLPSSRFNEDLVTAL